MHLLTGHHCYGTVAAAEAVASDVAATEDVALDIAAAEDGGVVVYNQDTENPGLVIDQHQNNVHLSWHPQETRCSNIFKLLEIQLAVELKEVEAELYSGFVLVAIPWL